MTITEIGAAAKSASVQLKNSSVVMRNNFLQCLIAELNQNTVNITNENQTDILAAKNNGLAESKIDRLLINSVRVGEMVASLQTLIGLPDPVGLFFDGVTRPNGLQICKKSVPLGVIGIIYESRPNVTIDSAAICIKSGNACILRGGSEAINTNIFLEQIIKNALEKSNLDKNCVNLLHDTSRNSAQELMQLKALDVIIPRGGAGLIKTVVENACVPVIETGTGNCHVYVESSANFDSAVDIIINAKVSRPSVCNAIETVLIDKAIAQSFLPILTQSLEKNAVEIHCCQQSLDILGQSATAVLATECDYQTEFGELILAIKIVDDITQAIDHITQYSTGHSECIISQNSEAIEKFLNEIDAAAVYVNASTRFTDGGEFGLGAEIGISTQKIHVRGPMGLSALTSYKYIVRGTGQTR